MMCLPRRLALLMPMAAPLTALLATPLAARAEERPEPVAWDTPEGQALVERLRQGGLALFFRHADTIGEPCDRSFRIGDRAGQRNISPRGREQSREIGERLRMLGIPVVLPVLAGPVYRARDTAEEAFGAANVTVTDSLLADDYAGGRLDWVLAEHRRLFSAPVPAGQVRVLVGHRTPGIMVVGPSISNRTFPEGSALVLRPLGSGFRLLGILMFAPIEGGGFHGCG